MSRTLKDMGARMDERRRRAILDRQRNRRHARIARTSPTVGHLRRGRRKQEVSPSEPTEKEDAI